MKSITSLIRRPDGLRIFECQLQTVVERHDGRRRKKRIAESQLRRLGSRGCSCPLSSDEAEVLRVWELLGKATFSRRTYRLLRQICVETTAAPHRMVEHVPRLSVSPKDIRPWLCDPDALVGLFLQLRAFDLEEKGGICDLENEKLVYHPWLLQRSGEKLALEKVELLSVVWERAACFASESSYEDLLELEKAYVDCLEDQALAALMELVLGHTQARGGAYWIQFWRRVPEDIRVKQIEHWMKHYPEMVGCIRNHMYLVKPALACDMKQSRGLQYLWDGIMQGTDTRQLYDGIHLWLAFGWDAAPKIYSGDVIDVDTLVRITKLLATRDFQDTVSSDLWDTMYLYPELTTSIQAILDQPYGHRGWLVRLIRCAKSYEPSAKVVHVFNRDFQTIASMIFTMPEAYREKAIEYFEWVYWDETVTMPAAELMGSISKLCCKPFSSAPYSKYVWQELMCKWGGAELPMSSWKRIDSGCRSEVQADALENGLERWDKDFARALLCSGLRLRVRLSLEVIRITCRSLSPIVTRAFEKLREHPLLDIDLHQYSGVETFVCLEGGSKDLDKWLAHLRGECSLRPESAEQLWQRLEGLRVEKLLVYVKNELLGFTENDSGLRLHTRLYAGAADRNSRVYGKLIRRYRKHGEQGILSHPRNQQWLNTHHYLRKGVWLTGLRAEIELENGDRVFLETERRFELVLQMGTLVNSCLSLEGCNSHAALANAADVNKQVVMAYDVQNRFLGRQLIAISEQRQLVVFDVYGQEKGRLLPAFAAFDFQLGELLALPLYDEGDYEIQRVVCREWYDDYAWNPAHERGATIIDRQWGGSRVAPVCD